MRITTHRQEAPYIFVLLMCLLIEAPFIHLLLSAWNHTAALVMAAISTFLVLQMIDTLIIVYRFGVDVSDEAVTVRIARHISFKLPRNTIKAVTRLDQTSDDSGSLYRATVMASPNVVIQLDTPIALRKLRRHRLSRAVALCVDDPALFVETIARLDSVKATR